MFTWFYLRPVLCGWALALVACSLTTRFDDFSRVDGGTAGRADADAADAASTADAQDASVSESPEFKIARLRVLDLDTGAPKPGYDSLTEGQVLSKGALGRFTIEAVPEPSSIGSVLFLLDGIEVKYENSDPFTITNDGSAWSPPSKTYEVAAVPFSLKAAQGVRGTSLRIHLVVTP